MSFTVLALILAVSLVGPLLFVPRWAQVPIGIGELLIGVTIGQTGLGWLHPKEDVFTFLAQVGFALVMFVAGTHVPLRDAALLPALRIGILRALLVGLLAVGVGWLIATVFDSRHGWLYAVVLASSSAALALPALRGTPRERPVIELMVQIAVADTLCLLALPLAIDPARAPRTALGALGVLVVGAILYLLLSWAERSGYRRQVHRVSEDNKLAVEIRVVLTLIFVLCAVALAFGLSVMLPGFVLGLVISAIGEPRRVARQAFAVTEGFFAPVFFVWFGAQLDLRGVDGAALGLGLALGMGALLCHLAGVFTRQPWALAGLGAAQLGVPIAAMTEAGRLGILTPGEQSALLVGMAVTLAGVAVSARRIPAGAQT